MKENKSFSVVLPFMAVMVFLIGQSVFAQDVVETPTRVFRGRVTKADKDSITLEMTVEGRSQEIAIPRGRVTRLSVQPPPSVVAGVEAYEAGDWTKARLNLERVILNYQGLDVEWAQRGMVYFGRASMSAGDDKNAELAFSAFLSTYPDHELATEARLGMADVERVRANHEAALETYRSVVDPFDAQLRPERQYLSYAAEAYLGIGKSLEAQGDLRAALDAYIRVVALYPAERAYPEALYRSAVVLSELAEFDKARHYIAELTSQYPATEFAREAIRLRSSIESM